MAQVQIIVVDGPNGAVDVKVEFDPPIDVDANQTPAQGIAGELINFLGMLGGENVHEEDE